MTNSIYICFDHDSAGEAGARLVGSMLHDAKIVVLPPDVGQAGDVSDFFLNLGKTTEDFDRLLAEAKPIDEHERVPPKVAPSWTTPPEFRSEIAGLKAQVSIEEWIGAELTLAVHGRNYVARCPFHDDRTPSFVVFSETQTFYCFGCRTRGDVFTFVMRTHGVTFADSMRIVRHALQDMSHGQAA